MPDSTPAVPAAALNPQLSAFDQLCDIVARLRAPKGCPWDREQTNETLLPGLIEEAYEVAGAVRARKAQKKAARVNFDWTETSDVVAKVDEELAETKEAMSSRDSTEIAAEIGDLLFAVVNLARKNGLDAESLLQAATEKFVSRFGQVEDELRESGRKLGEVGLEELDEIWNAVKVRGRQATQS